GAGYTLTGLLGGALSSTGVTLDYSRVSRKEPNLGGSLGYGVVGACTVLIPRIVIVSTVLNPAVGLRLAWLLVPPLICGVVIVFVGWRRERGNGHAAEVKQLSPLRLGVAIQMAVAFQVTLTLIAFVHSRWGTMALYPSAAVLGLTDMDALTFSMSRLD